MHHFALRSACAALAVVLLGTGCGSSDSAGPADAAVPPVTALPPAGATTASSAAATTTTTTTTATTATTTTTSTSTTTTTTPPTTTTTEVPPPLVLGFAGDTSFTHGLHASDPLAAVTDILSQPDLMFVNLETVVAEPGVGRPLAKTYTFRSDPVSVELLARAGIDGVSLANNHTLDYRVEGLTRTMELLDEGGLLRAGAGPDEAAAYAPLYVEAAGYTVGLVALTRVECAWAASGTHPEVAWTCDPWVDRGVAAVAEAAAGSDVTVVMVHWGVELHRCPQRYQRDLARAWIEAGAHIVVGGHPHILQGVEQIDGAWVIHSTGNFAFPSARAERADSAVFVFTVDGEEIGLQAVPVRIRGGAPEPASSDAVLKALNRYSFEIEFDDEGVAHIGGDRSACGD